MQNYVPFSDLTGKTLAKIVGAEDLTYLVFYCDDGSEYEMYHEQDCCESVSIEDICGDLDDLIGRPILQAEESSEAGGGTWTFYRLTTFKGQVVIRWYGISNGYYSESVSFVKRK